MKINFRSPSYYGDYSVCGVYEYGGVDYNFYVYFDDSCGIHSPGTDWGDISCYLGPDGNIFEDIDFYVDSVKDSYGFILRIVVNTMIIIVHIALTPMEKLIEHGWVAMLMIPAEFT